MIYNIIPQPDLLKKHQKFFNDLFNVFRKLLHIKINNPDKYEEKYHEYRFYLDDCEFYFYTKVAIPSPNYNKTACREILSHLNGVFKWNLKLLI